MVTRWLRRLVQRARRAVVGAVLLAREAAAPRGVLTIGGSMEKEREEKTETEKTAAAELHHVDAARELMTVAVLVVGACVSAWLGHEGLAMSLGGAAVALVTPLRAAGRAAIVGGALVVGGLAGCGGATSTTVPQVAHVACAVARPACAVVSSVCAVEAAATAEPAR